MTGRHRADILTIVLAAAVPPMTGQRPTAGNPGLAALADMTDITGSLKELSNVIQGINSFLSGVTIISQTIGFGTILLFVAVLLFSAGYSAMGMPKGKAAFLSSLVTADALWAAWNVSLNTALSDYLAPMIKSNLIVLCPLIIVAVMSRAFPAAGRMIGSALSSLIGRKQKISAGTAADLFGEYRERCARLDRAVLEDIIAAGGGGKPVNLSPETRTRAEELRETLAKMEAARAED